MNQLTMGYFYYFGISSMFLLGLVYSCKLIQVKVGCEFKMKQLLLSDPMYSYAGITMLYSSLTNPSVDILLFHLKNCERHFKISTDL